MQKYPVIRVLITKKGLIRARIKENRGVPSYEVTIGTKSWAVNKKGFQHKAIIRKKALAMINVFRYQYYDHLVD